MSERKTQVLIAMQLALLGEIGPNLRAVTVVFSATSVRFMCYFDDVVGDQDRASMLCVDTEVVATFPESHAVNHSIHRLDAPSPIPKDSDTHFVYLRRE